MAIFTNIGNVLGELIDTSKYGCKNAKTKWHFDNNNAYYLKFKNANIIYFFNFSKIKKNITFAVENTNNNLILYLRWRFSQNLATCWVIL